MSRLFLYLRLVAARSTQENSTNTSNAAAEAMLKFEGEKTRFRSAEQATQFTDMPTEASDEEALHESYTIPVSSARCSSAI